jgi:RNA polymerase sigma-70 factor (ECF subfamily)
LYLQKIEKYDIILKKLVRFSSLGSLINEGGDSVTDFEKAYKQYFNDVYLYILRLSGNEHIAEEITSDTFFKAMQSIDSFRGDCDVRVWLCQIAKNAYYSYIKKNSRTEQIDEAEIQEIKDLAPGVAEEYERREEIERIQKILHDVGEPYKEVFMWRVYAELSFRQIAQIFGKTENWACVTYHRARKIIKERLEGEHHENGV